MDKTTALRRLIAILIKDEAAWAALHERLAAAMTRAWSFGVEEAFRRALERLRGVDPARFSAADERVILGAIETQIGGEAMRRAMEGPVATLSEAIYRVGASEGAKPAGIDYAFGVKDERALALLNRFDLHWIGRHWDAGTRETVTGAVRAFFEQGWSYETLADRLKEAFAGIEERGLAYWQLTADTIATKTREIARVGGYEQAQVKYVQVRAHMDERTTAICRSLHGRLIHIGHIQAQRDRYLDAIARGHMEAAKSAWPMMPAEHEVPGGKALPGNIGLPPYHFRCRTITVAYLGADPDDVAREGDAVDQARLAVRWREPVGRAQLNSLIERALLARWDAGQLAAHRKHAVRGIEDYNRSAIELIRGRQIKRQIALAMSNGQLMGVFFAPYKGRKQQVAVVNLERLALVTHHIRKGLESQSYEIQPIVQPKSERIVKGALWPW